MRRFTTLLPDRLSGQIILLMFVAIALFQLATTTTYMFGNPQWRTPVVEPNELIASSLLALNAAPASNRPALLAKLSRSSPWLSLSVHDNAPAAIEPGGVRHDLDLIGARLWDGARVERVAAPEINSPRTAIAVQLQDGAYAIVSQLAERRTAVSTRIARDHSLLSLLPTHVWERSVALFFLCATVITIWLSGAVVRPLVRLARQAEHFPDENGEVTAIAEDGPREVRDLSRAFNRMQGRIQSILISRSRALAAISHDLRTIITRIRLRSEFIADVDLRSKMLHDVELMDAMLHKNLMYLRGEREDPQRSLIDLDSVLQTIADQFSDLGHNVTYQGGEHQTVFGSLSELQRLFSNLVENAVAYGTNVEITATTPADGFIEIDIADDGPGIPKEQRARVMEPFVRGEPGRTVNTTSGFGLGLSIVKSLVDRAGGKFEIRDRTPRGMIARVSLPAAYA